MDGSLSSHTLLQAKKVSAVRRPPIDSDFESDSGKDLQRASLHEGNWVMALTHTKTLTVTAPAAMAVPQYIYVACAPGNLHAAILTRQVFIWGALAVAQTWYI